MTDWHKIVLMVSPALAGVLLMTALNHTLRHILPGHNRGWMDRLCRNACNMIARVS